MHSLFERISNLLFDFSHFIAALDGERISVGFHVVEEHEGLVQEFISCWLSHHVSLVIIEFGKHIHLGESFLLIGDSCHCLHHILNGGDAVEGIRTHVLIVEFLNLLTSHLHLFLFEQSFECRHKLANQSLYVVSL